MAARVRSVLLAIVSFFSLCLAQFGPDQRWLNPDGSKQDFTSSFGAGDTITLSWKALNQSKSDLWLTHWDPTTYPWHYQVAASVDLSNAGTLQWYINIPASTIQNDNRFVLRFYPLNAPYAVLQIPQLDSPGFTVTGGIVSSTTQLSSSSGQATKTTSASSASTVSTKASSSSISGSGGVSSTDSSSASSSRSISSSLTTAILTTTNEAGSTVTATITTSIPSATGISGSPQSGSASSSSNLSIAGQAGIGVAAGLFIIILFIAGCFFGRRFGIGRTFRGNEHGLEREGFPMHQKNGTTYSDTSLAEVESTTTKVQTSDSRDNAMLISRTASYQDDGRWQQSRTPWAEVSGSNNFPIEKSGAMVRPGVHELV